MLPIFRVLPWDHAGCREDVAAHAVTTAPWASGRVLLKVRQNGLFFREEFGDQTWGCGQPVSINSNSARDYESEPQDIIERFEGCQELDDVGRIFRFRRQVSSYYHRDSTVIALVRRDGSGFCREFWDSCGLPFSKPEGASLPLLESWNQEFFESYMEKIWLRGGRLSDFYTAFDHRVVPEAVLRSEPLHFVRGSLEQLETMVRRLMWAWPQEFSRVQSCLYACNAPFEAAELGLLDKGHGKITLPANLAALCDLILEENIGVGWEWSATANEGIRNPTTRGCCEVMQQLRSISLLSPSGHETLEARLFWRDFLQNKWPHEQIAALFAH